MGGSARGPRKKLTRAAQALWGGVAVSDELVSDVMAETGAEREEAVRIARKMLGSDERIIILPVSERDTIRLALASAGQWRMAPSGLGGARPIALDMTAVDVTARWLGIQPSAHLFDGLAIMEREALKSMRKTQ